MVITKLVFVVLGILFKNNHEILKLLHLSDDALALFVGVLLQYICNLDQGLLRQPLECRHLEKSNSIIRPNLMTSLLTFTILDKNPPL